jgi:hypothetical protein
MWDHSILLDEGGESMRSWVKEKSSMVCALDNELRNVIVAI